MHKVMNGYTIVAHEYVAGRGYYVVLGSRRQPDGYEYVTANVWSIDIDTEWFWGHYSGTHFAPGIAAAVFDFNQRKGV